MNACCEFDLKLLKPTYKLLIGIPGKSNAFAISKRLGLEQSIIDRARTFITSDNISIEELLKNIYDNKQKIENEKDEIEKNLAQVELLRKSFEKKNSALLSKENSIIEKAKTEARKILQDAKEQVSMAIQEINISSKNIDNSSIRNLNNTRNKLNDSIKKASSIVDDVNNKAITFLTKDDIYIGMPVLVTNLNQARNYIFFSK